MMSCGWKGVIAYVWRACVEVRAILATVDPMKGCNFMRAVFTSGWTLHDFLPHSWRTRSVFSGVTLSGRQENPYSADIGVTLRSWGSDR